MKRRSILLLVLLSFVPAVVSAAPFAYITNGLDNTVSVIDTATDTVIATVPVGQIPHGVAVNPAGTRVYVTGFPLSVLETTTNSVMGTLMLSASNVINPARAVAVASSPNGAKVYVAHSIGSFSVIDASTNTVITTKTVQPPQGASEFPARIVVSPDGTRLYITTAGFGPSFLYVIDTATNEVLQRLKLGTTHIGIAINPQGTRLYVVDFGKDSLYAVDTATNSVVNTIPAGESPWDVALNPGGTTAYVTNYMPANLSVIDITTSTVIATVPVGVGPQGVAVNPEGTKVYVVNADNTVSVIDAATNTLLKTIGVGREPSAFGKFIGPKPMPIPTAQTVIPYQPTISPVFDPDSIKAKPFATGTLAGGTLSLSVGLPIFSAPVDVYLGIHAPSISAEALIVQPDNSLLPNSQAFVPWKTNTGGPVEASLYGDIPITLLPTGTYTLYVAVTPPGRLDVYYLWYTIFVIP